MAKVMCPVFKVCLQVMLRDQLVEVRNSVRKPGETSKSPDGTTVLLLPHDGRVLGLHADDNSENVFWTNSALENADMAKAFFESELWHDTG